MLGHLILSGSIAEAPAIITRHSSTSWEEMKYGALRIAEVHRELRNRRIGLCLLPSAKSYAALAALDELKCDVFLLDSRLARESALRTASALRLGVLLMPGESQPYELEADFLPDESAGSRSSTVTILTSGSTGHPKAAQHTWESLSRPVRRSSENQSPRWLLTYRPNLYAGLQVMLQCFANGGALVIPDADQDPRATAQLMYDAQVQYVSATPSYWRRLLMFADPCVLRKIPLTQITLGGEVVDQAILDKLRQHFPSARLVHIYATTELGRCFSVNDGMAGFPSKWLDTVLSDEVQLRNQDGELLVRSPNAMRRYDALSAKSEEVGDWFATGDLIEIRESRAYFVGRKADMINVAGSKVYPLEVERTIRNVPGVRDVRVFGKASSIAGELVACEIVPEANQSPERLKEAVIRSCRSHLATYQQPRLIRFVDCIEVSAAGKILRTKTQ